MKKIPFLKGFIKRFIKHPLFAGSFIMIFGNLGVNVINYIYHLLMGRILGPVDYGVLASLFSILYIIGIVPQSTSFAITKFISSAKNVSEVKSIYHTINKFIFSFALIISILVGVSSPLIANFLHIKGIWSVVMIAPILFAILITLVNQATSQGLLKFGGVVIPSLVSSLGKIILGISFVLAGFGVFGAVFGIVLGAAVAYFSSTIFIKEILKVKTGESDFTLSKFLKYAFPVLLQALAFTSLFSTDVILVKHFLSPFEAGIYAALSTLGKIIYFASSPITATMFPIVSGRKARGEGYQKIFFMSLAVTALLSAAIVIIYLFFPGVTIGMLYGKAYLSAKTELVWMGVFILFYTLSSLLVNFSLSLGKVKIVVFPLIISLIQIPAIWFFHNSILQVIQISLGLSALLFLMLILYLGYNRLAKSYEKE